MCHAHNVRLDCWLALIETLTAQLVIFITFAWIVERVRLPAGSPEHEVPSARRQGIAPVIVCLFDRERGIGTDSVVNKCQ